MLARKLYESLFFFVVLVQGFLPACGQSRPSEAHQIITVHPNGTYTIPGNLFDTVPLIETARTKNSIHNFHSVSNVSQHRRIYRTGSAIVLYIILTNPTCAYNIGSIVVQATNGTPPYTYILTDQYNSQTVQLTGNFPLLPAGPYIITVTDANGLSTNEAVTLQDILPGVMSANSNIIYPGCAANNGSVTLQTTGGVPPYTYSMDMVNFQSSPVFSNLYIGFYTIITKDVNGCIYRGLLNLLWNNPNCSTPIGISYTPYECTSNGNISVTHYGNQGPYTYSIDGINYQSNGDFSNLGSGVYLVYIKNSAGVVVDVRGINILHDCNIQIDFVNVDAACGQNDGVLTVVAVNGTAPYTYSIDGVNYQTSNVFSGLAPGNYSITVKDFNGVTHSKQARVYDRCPVVRAVSTGESCAGNDGTITAGGFKGTPPYLFSLDGINFQSNNVFTGLTAGNYTVTLKDALNFTATVNASVSNACLPFTISVGNATCNIANGSLTINVAGGTPPYQYSLDGVNYQPGNIFSSLAAGLYTVRVKDAAARSASRTVTIVNIPGAVVTASSSPATCLGNNGTVTIQGNGGTTPYLYSLDGINFQASGLFTNLTPANYTARIKDANNCITSTAVAVTISCPSVSSTISNETCSQRNGSITATGSSGTAPYQYSIDGINFQSATLFSNLSAGFYTVTIRDVVGAVNTTQAIVNNICPSVTATVTDGLCGSANGIIIATGSNSTAPYMYSLNGVNFQSSNIFNNLTSGVYTITVRDANGLTNTTTAQVRNFPSPVVTVNVTAATCINSNGKLQLTPTGGVTPLQYSVDGVVYQSIPVFQNLSSGNYTAWVKDANGCKDSELVFVPVNNDLILNTGNAVTICEGKSVILPASSNATNFTWTPAIGLSNPNILNPIASPLTDTVYTVNAVLGVCSLNGSVNVTVNPAPVANAGADIIICAGKSAVLSGSGGVSYQWTPSTFLDNANSPNPTVVKPAYTVSYNLSVKDLNGCESLNNESVTVTVTPPPVVFAGNDTLVVLGSPFQMNATDVNNAGFVSYSWTPSFGLNNPAIKNPTTSIDQDTKYTVSAITAAGCEGSDDIIVKVCKGPEIYVPSAFTPNNDGVNDILKAIPVGIKEFKYFKIYNRWGQPIFSTTNPSIGWNGNYKGQFFETTVFVWIAEGIDNAGTRIIRKGSVTMIR